MRPPLMIEACITALMQGRLPERDIYTEKFISAADAQQSTARCSRPSDNAAQNPLRFVPPACCLTAGWCVFSDTRKVSMLRLLTSRTEPCWPCCAVQCWRLSPPSRTADDAAISAVTDQCQLADGDESVFRPDPRPGGAALKVEQGVARGCAASSIRPDSWG